MTLELGLIFALGIMFFGFFVMLFSLHTDPKTKKPSSRFSWAGASLLAGMGGVSVAVLILDLPTGWQVLLWTGYAAMLFGVASMVASAIVAYRHFRDSHRG